MECISKGVYNQRIFMIPSIDHPFPMCIIIIIMILDVGK